MKRVWSETWYARHMDGTGLRVKVRPTYNAVFGGAGSVSQIVRKGQSQTKKINNHQAIRLKLRYLRDNPALAEVAWPLEDYLKDKKQRSLDEFD